MRTIVDQSGSMIYRQTQEIESLRQQLADKQAIIDDWLYANGPNGWIESLRQQLSGANARIELMGETALNQQKREVLLRVKLSEISWSNDSKWQSDCAKEALASTTNLDDLILCEKKPFEFRWELRSNGFVQHTEKLLHTISKDLWYITPLYRAWEPK